MHTEHYFTTLKILHPIELFFLIDLNSHKVNFYMKSESNGTEASYQLNGALKNDKKNPRRDLHKAPKMLSTFNNLDALPV